jgi:hypothetical protein
MTKRAERTAAMIWNVLQDRLARGIITEADLAIAPKSAPTEEERFLSAVRKRLDRMRATEALAEGLFVKYDRAMEPL